jgi:hypothetical protein
MHSTITFVLQIVTTFRSVPRTLIPNSLTIVLCFSVRKPTDINVTATYCQCSPVLPGDNRTIGVHREAPPDFQGSWSYCQVGPSSTACPISSGLRVAETVPQRSGLAPAIRALVSWSATALSQGRIRWHDRSGGTAGRATGRKTGRYRSKTEGRGATIPVTVELSILFN